MKRILHIISQYPGKTGSGVYLNELIREAYNKGYSQAVVGAIDDEGYVNPYISEEDTYLLEFNTEKIPFPIFGMSDEMPYKTKRYIDMTDDELKLYKRSFKEIINKAIREFEPEVIFTHHLWLVTSMMKDVDRDIKIIGLCHGTDIRQLNAVERFKEKVVEGSSRLDLVLALNQEQQREIESLYNIDREKILIIGGGYNNKLFYPNLDRTSSVIRLVYAGKISYVKGLMSLLKAIDRIEDCYKFELVIAGRGFGKQYNDILEYGRNISREGREVIFLGEISQKEVGQVFRKSDIFIMPSFYEGLSLVTIEALASGLLVVCSEIEGLISYLGKDINESGIIEYVKLPNMYKGYIDKPIEEDLEDYEEKLKIAIERQMDNIKNRDPIYVGIESLIRDLSWEKIFDTIEEYIG